MTVMSLKTFRVGCALAFLSCAVSGSSALAQSLEDSKAKDDERRARFNEIYAVNHWGDETSRSGPGSRLDSTEAIRAGLVQLFASYPIHSVLDAACGDFWWMKEVPMPNISYEGWDISSGAIAFDNAVYGATGAQRTFVVGDIITDKIPAVDLIIARDVLVHMSDINLKRAIANIKASGSKYLLTTHFLECDAMSNIDTIDGEHRPFDLTLAPFFFPQPEAMIKEDYDVTRSICRDKVMGLWTVENLPDFF